MNHLLLVVQGGVTIFPGLRVWEGHEALERHLVSTSYSSFCNSNCNIHLRRVSDREKWTCEHGHDLQKRSICSGTWLVNSSLTLAEGLKLTYMWAHHHTQEEAQHEARGGNNVTVRWYYKHREACVAWLLSKDDKIGGKGQIVEIDESSTANRSIIVVTMWMDLG